MELDPHPGPAPTLQHEKERSQSPGCLPAQLTRALTSFRIPAFPVCPARNPHTAQLTQPRGRHLRSLLSLPASKTDAHPVG